MSKYMNVLCVLCVICAFASFPLTLYQIHKDKISQYTYLRSVCEESVNSNANAWVCISKIKDNTDDKNLKDLADSALVHLGKSRDATMKIRNFIDIKFQ